MRDVFRQEYTPLTDEKRAMQLTTKKLCQQVFDHLQLCREHDDVGIYEMDQAEYRLEEASMWAVKAITA